MRESRLVVRPVIAAVVVVLLPAVLGCSSQKEPTGKPLNAEDYRLGDMINLNVPGSGNIASALEGHDGFEGDIQLNDEQKEIFKTGTDEQRALVRSASTNQRHKWPKVGDYVNVPYTFTSDFSQAERALIARGFQDYHKNTCIRMVERINEADYVAVFKGNPGACWSSVGRQGGEQKLSLGEGCPDVGVVVHEFMHAIGFWHEQSRSDRDKNIEIHWENIRKGMEHNFEECARCSNLGSTYDTTSVMHYHQWAFTANGKKTLTKKGCSSCQLGQYDGLSSSDATEINTLYCGGTNPGDDANVCEDNPTYDQNCEDWANFGFCHAFGPFMRLNCKKSCDVCTRK